MNILIAAVGGQGALLSARVLAEVGRSVGSQVKVSEIHGMSQRGGSVTTHVRIAPVVHSPVIERGAVDVLLAFELLEAARYVEMLRPGGTLLANTQRILPLPVLTGAVDYPASLPAELCRLDLVPVLVDATKIASELLEQKVTNTVLLGVFAGLFWADLAPFELAVEALVPERHREINRRALGRGFELGRRTTQGKRA